MPENLKYLMFTTSTIVYYILVLSFHLLSFALIEMKPFGKKIDPKAIILKAFCPFL